jgi:hypothetical protein
MSPSTRFAWTRLAACAAVLTAACAAQEASYQSSLTMASAAARRGDYAQAKALFAEAAGMAPTDQQKQQALLATADLLARSGPAGLEEAKEAYGGLLESADPSIRRRAQNNFATLLLRSKDAEKAVTILEALAEDVLKDQATSSSDKARCLYNAGRALEDAGRRQESLRRFAEAVAADPSMDLAVQAAIRVARRVEPDQSIPALAKLVEGLLGHGAVAAAETVAHALLTDERLRRSGAFDDALVSVMKVLTAGNVGREKFASTWAPELFPPSEAASDRRKIAAVIEAAYVAAWPPSVHVPDSLRASRDDPAFVEVYSWFLKAVGDTEAASGRMMPAYLRYAAAFAIDGDNAEAALSMANLLGSDRLEMDAKERDRLVDNLVGQLFQSKGRAYLGKDDEKIMRFHTILAGIFERRGNWADAKVHWRRAEGAHERLKPKQGAPRAAPGIHLGLARVASAEKNDSAAWDEYLSAAEDFAALKDPSNANGAMKLATGLPHRPTSAQEARRVRVEQQLAPRARPREGGLERPIEDANLPDEPLNRVRRDPDESSANAAREADAVRKARQELAACSEKVRQLEADLQAAQREVARVAALQAQLAQAKADLAAAREQAARRGDGSSLVPALERLLGEGQSRENRLGAVLLLGELGAGARSAVPELKRLLRTRDAELKAAVEAALRKIG